ncbi:MAG: hypothetical protein IJC84_00940 [Clostridia bacterium]|nr:hypothetical protein [Clostridia bacterium]
MLYWNKHYRIQGFLHFRTDIGDGVRSAILFRHCQGDCHCACLPYPFIPEHAYGEDAAEKLSYTVAELKAYLTEEKLWYSSGPLGINFMGAEPMREADLCYDLARHVKKLGMHLQVETCGHVSEDVFKRMRPVTDLFLLRLLSPIPHLHRPFRDYSYEQVWSRLCFLDQSDYPNRIQIPVIQGLNHHAAGAFATVIMEMKNFKSVVLDFRRSGMSDEEIAQYRAVFKNYGIPLY